MFPNAAKGVKKIFAAEIIEIIAAVLSIIAIIIGLAGVAAGAGGSEEGALVGVGSAGVIILISLILLIVAFILSLVGIVNASKDEPAFKIALYGVIASIVISLVRSIFSSAATLVSICDILLKVAQIAVTVFIIQGIINLATKLNNEKVAGKGKTLLYIIVCVYVLSALTTIVSAIFGAGSVAANILGIVSEVLEIVQGVVFIILLAQAKKMLAQA